MIAPRSKFLSTRGIFWNNTHHFLLPNYDLQKAHVLMLFVVLEYLIKDTNGPTLVCEMLPKAKPLI